MVDRLLNNRWIKLWFALSVTAFVALQISGAGSVIGVLLNYLAAFVLTIFFEHKHKVLSKLFEIKSKKSTLIALPIAIYTTIELVLSFRNVWIGRFFAASQNSLVLGIRSRFSEQLIGDGLNMASIAAGIAALFFIFAIVYAVLSRAGFIKNALCAVCKNADKIERWYAIAGFIAFSVLVFCVYGMTEMMYTTQVKTNVVFTMDSPLLVQEDFYFSMYNTQNDIRQPLFTLLTMPFAVVAKILSIPLFFLPSAYILIMQLIQVVFLLVMAILLVRMSGIEDRLSKTAFLLLYSFTYPVMLFSFAVEQYIPSVFILILVLYRGHCKKQLSAGLVACCSGVLLTNAIIVPFITFEKKLMAWARSVIKVVAGFVVLCIFCGKLSVLFGAFSNIKNLLLNYGSVGAAENSNKLYQFTHFIKNCFVAPKTETVFVDQIHGVQLAVPTGISLVGVALLCVSIAGAIINRKLLFARICGLWVLFSIVLLYVMGWGSPENGMILYSFYIGWAFFVLAFLLFENMLEKLSVLKYVVYPVGFVAMAVLNIGGIVELIKFGIQYYPVR